MKTLVRILLPLVWLTFSFAELDVGVEPFKKYPESCSAAKAKKNGVYKIQPKGQPVMSVYCDVFIAGSPWMVIQRRVDVNINFYRNWASYQQGFGDLDKNYFIGLDKLNALTTSQPYELYIHLADFEGQQRFAQYTEFAIGNGANSYSLTKLGFYSGNAGDGLRHHQNVKFSTYDRDNDNSARNLAVEFTGAWWYNTTHFSNLNGLYLGGEYDKDQYGRGITWYFSHGDLYSLKATYMMIRPRA
ncbi:ryncolin-4 [Drosophila grimshawi]|uniref:GH21158 n=1 Tax=Drosophila grimshawi TaxID=7222 RepID=B4J6M8_DROGR|nr:ryncolin-4 [Drosophila grimshawi]EDW00931.1 GH21158 [Drosophila grimshawi]